MSNIKVAKPKETAKDPKEAIDIDKLKLYYEEEHRLCRETDWRLQIAYAGPTAYISSLFVAIGLAINALQNTSSFLGNTQIVILAIAFALGNAMFIGVFAGNHYIEKKIEMYMLENHRQVYKLTGEQHFGWITYQYGYQKFSGKLDVLTHAGVGVFQYGIPAILAAASLAAIPFITSPKGLLLGLYIFTILCLVLAVLALFSLTRYSIRVKKQYTDFYNKLNPNEKKPSKD